MITRKNRMLTYVLIASMGALLIATIIAQLGVSGAV